MPNDNSTPDLAMLQAALESSLADISSGTLEQLVASGSRVVNYSPTLQIFLETLPDHIQVAVLNAFLVKAAQELGNRQDDAQDGSA